MSIIINERNRDKIEAKLKKANGRATTHVVDCLEYLEELVCGVHEHLRKDLPVKEHTGARAVILPGNDLPNSYKWQVHTTKLTIERRPSGWALVDAELVKRSPKSADCKEVFVTQKHIDKMNRRLKARYTIVKEQA